MSPSIARTACPKMRDQRFLLKGRLCRALALLVAMLSLSCGAAKATTFMVTVGPAGSLSFSPATLTIQAGDTVQWVWGSSGHSSTSGPGAAGGIWDSGIHNINDTFSHTFSTTGSFPYFCDSARGLLRNGGTDHGDSTRTDSHTNTNTDPKS